MFSRRLGTFISNVIAIIASFLIAYTFRFGWEQADTFRNINDVLVLSYLVLCYIAVFMFYRGSNVSGRRGLFRLLKESFLNTVFEAGLFASIVYMAHITDSIPRLFFAYFFTIYFGLSFVITGIVHTIFRSIQAHHKRQTVIFTDRKDKEKVIRNLIKNGADDFEVIGVAVIDSKDKSKFYRVTTKLPNTITSKAAEAGLVSVDADSLVYRFEKDEDDAVTFLKRHNVNLVIISVDHLDRARMASIIDIVGEMGIDSMVTLDSFAMETFDSKLEDFGTLEVVRFAPRIFSDISLFFKRVLDIIGGFIGCLFTAILFIFVAPAILIEDGFPIFFKQKRVGKNGKYFYMYKFRSMYRDAEERRKKLMKSGKNEMDGAMFKMKDDPRITKVGKFIRKTSIDEFPQFFNVLKGDMSLVGTRPPMIDEYQQYSSHHKRRLSLKPGITGLWQTSGRSQITDFEEVVRLDCYYIDHWSVLFDIKILFMTIVAVITGKGSE
jgi:lipopolysaccharide/colanic/teichoic acid biosynthesis glycosyltransferase